MSNLKPITKIPSYSGLYLIGSVYLNQCTNKPLYCVKIGQSKNLERRINQYYTYNPIFKLIDYIPIDSKNLLKKEKSYHEILSRRSKWSTGEWFIIEKDTYFDLIENGFNILNFTF